MSIQLQKKVRCWLIVLLVTGSSFGPAMASATTIGTNITTNNLTLSGALKITTGANNNYILKSDAAGNASWVSLSAALANASLADLGTKNISDTAGTLAPTRGGTGLTSYSTGDLVYASAANTLSSLAVGTNGQVLTLTAGVPTWATSPAGFADPMTTRGDMIFRNSANNTARLQRGGAGTVLKSDGTDISWQSLSASDVGLGNVTNDAQIAKSVGTTKGDVIAFTGSGAPVRLGVGTNGQVLTADSAQASGVKWATPASGFADPMTTIGDMIYRDGTNTTNRLGIGGAGTVLKSNGTNMSWQSLAASDVGLGNVTNDAQIAKSIGTTKGDVIAFTGSGAPVRLGVGGDGQVLTADSAQASGVKWAAAGGTGTVTSVDGSGGTTGLTLTGGPITGSGTLTLGGTLNVANGGTGLNSYTAGDIIYAQTPTMLNTLPLGSDGKVIKSNGLTLSWQTLTKSDVGLSNVTNDQQLTVSNNLSDLQSIATAKTNLQLNNLTNDAQITRSMGGAKGDLIVYSAAATPNILNVGSDGMVLVASSGAPNGVAWQTSGVANGGTGLTSYLTGDLIYASGANTLTTLTAGSNGDVLTLAGGVPTWAVSPAGFSNPMTTNGDIIVQKTGLPTRLGLGTAGKILRSNGTDLVYSTAIYPDQGVMDGDVMRSDGTNFYSQQVFTDQKNPSGAVVTNSVTCVMAGLGGTLVPQHSKKAMIIISGDMQNITSSRGAKAQIRYGQGSPPVGGAATTGTALGGEVRMMNSSFNQIPMPFSTNAIVYNLTHNTTYWVDLCVASISSAGLHNATFSDLSLSVFDL